MFYRFDEISAVDADTILDLTDWKSSFTDADFNNMPLLFDNEQYANYAAPYTPTLDSGFSMINGSGDMMMGHNILMNNRSEDYQPNNMFFPNHLQ